MQLRTGHQAEGIADLEQSLQLAPLAPAAEMLVLTELYAGRWEQATESAKKLQQAQPNSPVARNLLGVIALAQFNLEEAHTVFSDLVAKYPDFIVARLNLARVLDLQGKSDKAEDILQQILKQWPTDGAALTQTVDFLSRNGKGDAAIAAAGRAHAAMPENPAITAGLIDLYIARGDKEKALSLARRENGKNEPSNIPLIAARARAEAAKELKSDAAESYRRLIEIAPSYVNYRRQLAALLLSSEDNAGGQRVIDQALEREPKNQQLAEDRIAIEFKVSGIAGALATANHLRTKNPDLATSAALEGDAYMIARQYAEAEESYAKVLQQSPSAILALRLAKAKSAAGDADGAAAFLRKWSAAHPDDTAVLATLAAYDLTAHRFDAAREELEKVTEGMSRDPINLNNLAWLYQKTGDPRARSIAERAYLLAPNVPQIKDTLGWILAQQGQAPAGVELLQEASAAGSVGPEVRYHLAVALNEIGRRAEALKILTELINGSTSFDEKPAAEKLLAELSKG
jgi:putative PEP-CTERM system TPR-repeat lipoprotein